MSDIWDTFTASEEVDLGSGRKLTVREVSLYGMTKALTKAPALAAALMGDEKTAASVELSTVLTTFPEAGMLFIAAATGDIDDETHVKNVKTRLNSRQQARLFETALRLTMPEGLGPFVEGVGAEMAKAMAALRMEASES